MKKEHCHRTPPLYEALDKYNQVLYNQVICYQKQSKK